MPNIELHGLHRPKALETRDKIFKLFQEKPYFTETVVTIYPTETFNEQGLLQPFIRVVNNCQKHTEEIIVALKTFGLDIEHLELKAFIPGGVQEANPGECPTHGSIEHMQAPDGICPGCGQR